MALTASQINVSSKAAPSIQGKCEEKALLCTKVILTAWQILTWSFKQVAFKGKKKKCFPNPIEQRDDLQPFFVWLVLNRGDKGQIYQWNTFQRGVFNASISECSCMNAQWIALWPSYFDTECVPVQRVWNCPFGSSWFLVPLPCSSWL